MSRIQVQALDVVNCNPLNINALEIFAKVNEKLLFYVPYQLPNTYLFLPTTSLASNPTSLYEYFLTVPT